MIKIYHNPRCGTSRTVLQQLRDQGLEPEVIDYQKTPLTEGQLSSLFQQAGITPREAIRAKEPLFGELGLDDPSVADAQLLKAMATHPILLNRPFVVTDKGARLCRPASVVDEIL